MNKVQEALKSALFTIRCYRTEITLDKKRPNDLIEVDQVISEIDAALSDIEKCEPVAYMYQHEETGNIGFIDQWQVDNGFEKNNPRLKIITSLYTSPQPIERREPAALVALNNAALQKRIDVLEDLLTSAAVIAGRNGEGTHWERFIGQLKVNGIGNITAKTFRVLPSDEGYTSPISKECEPVAEALHERNRLGYAVVDVIGTLDEIIENAQEVEVDDFLHIAIPIDKWHELQDALEEMPKRAELYTSPISKEWVGLSDEAIESAMGSIGMSDSRPLGQQVDSVKTLVRQFAAPISKDLLETDDGKWDGTIKALWRRLQGRHPSAEFWNLSEIPDDEMYIFRAHFATALLASPIKQLNAEKG
jgi:hypothetical protein